MYLWLDLKSDFQIRLGLVELTGSKIGVAKEKEKLKHHGV